MKKKIVEKQKQKRRLKLESECRHCHGTDHCCVQCDGSGYVPTKAGEEILELVRRNYAAIAN